MRAARKHGLDIQSVRQFRQLGVAGMLAIRREGERYYVTIDIDGFDPSIAAGTAPRRMVVFITMKSSNF